MGKRSPSPPPAPDPAATAQAQAATNREASIAGQETSMINQYTPYGNIEYSQRGTSKNNNPQYSARQTLSPSQQKLFDLQNEASRRYGQVANTQMGNVADRLSSPLTIPGQGPVANEAMRQNVYDSIIQRNSPLADQQYQRLQTQMANQGLSDPNSEAYRAGMDEFYRGQNDFGLAAQQQALGQMGQMYGLEASSRDRLVNEMVMERSQPLNELAAMLSGSQVQNPQFVNTPQTQVAPADIMGATYGSYNGQMNAFNAQQQARNSGIAGLGNLAGNLGGAAIYKWSDRRLKRDISQIGFLANGLPVYLFKYNWSDDWHTGLMADEVRKVNPAAVVTTLSGFDAVNYAEAVR